MTMATPGWTPYVIGASAGFFVFGFPARGTGRASEKKVGEMVIGRPERAA
jgi:hypothetical protein